MAQTLADLVTSKKFLTAVLSIAVYLAGRFGFHLDESALEATVGPLWLYIVGQAVADHGSTAASITAAGAPTTAPQPTAAPASAPKAA